MSGLYVVGDFKSPTTAKVNRQNSTGDGSINSRESGPCRRLPGISVVAADHLDGPVTIEVPALNNNFNWWYVGIGVKYNLSSLFKSKGKIRRARSEVRQAEMMHRLVQEDTDISINAGYTDFMTSFADLRTLHRILSIPAYRHPRQHAGLRHIVGMAHVPL